MSTDADAPPEPPNKPSRALAAAEVALIFLVFFIYAAWPVPEVNETHYLAKAKHYWNPAWCANDFFCQSADAHQVFYWTFGWLSLWLPLPALAWVGRLTTWLLLAYAWRRLSWAIVPRPLYAVLSGALMITMLARLHMAGEWVVGGVEAKGYCYALVFLGLEALVRGRWNRTWLWFGGGAAFHVIIGGWAVVAGGVAWLLEKNRPSLKSMMPALFGGLALSLFGLLPAIRLTVGLPAEVVDEANRIYVYERLAHHLVPQRFNVPFIERHEILFVVWLALAYFLVRTNEDRRMRGFVIGTALLAGVGIVLGLVFEDQPIVAARWLRYYWFRMTDVMLPVGVALLLAATIARLRTSRPACGGWLLFGAMAGTGWCLADTIVYRRENMVPPADTSTVSLKNWRAICQWTRENTSEDALFLTPRMAQTFRWYAERAEFVSRKDIPQDATGIVEWWRRMQEIHALRSEGTRVIWQESLTQLGSEKLRLLADKYGIDYVITEAQPRLALELVSPPNPFYAVYRLPKSSQRVPRASETDEQEPRQRESEE